MGRPAKTAAFVALARALRGAHRPGEPGVTARLRAVPRLVVATLSGRYTGTTRSQLGLVALALLYVVSPLDVVPDVIPLLGITDDAFVITWLAGRILGETEEFLRWEREESPAAGPQDDVVAGHVVHG